MTQPRLPIETGLRAGSVGIDPEPLGVRSRAWMYRNGIVGALLLEILFFWSRSDRFLTTDNFRLILLQVAVIGIVAVPSGLLLLSGYIDFSVGSTLGLSAVVLGTQMENGTHAVLAAAIALAVGGAVGAAQGFLATWMRFPPIIVTLGFFTAIRGLTFVVSDGKLSSGFSSQFATIGQDNLPGTSIPIPVVIAAGLFVLGGLFHIKTRWGRYVVALGVNADAARRAGISPYRIPFILYVVTGLVSALGAIVLVSRLNSAPPTLGEGTEIDVLSAVLLGGVAFGGGKGNLLGVAAGVVFIGILNNGLLLMGADPFWVRVSAGAALVAAAALDAFSKYAERRAVGGGR